MNTKELIDVLLENEDALLHLWLPSEEFVPSHFHITEVGKTKKDFIDCGGVLHEELSCVLQVWTAQDKDHRMLAGKLAKILKLADSLNLNDLPVVIEYGPNVASQYMLSNIDVTSKGLVFDLIGRQTDCLAPDKCGVNKCGNKGCC